MKKHISHTKAQLILLIIWAVSLCASIYVIRDVAIKISNDVKRLDDAHAVLYSVGMSCAERFEELRMLEEGVQFIVDITNWGIRADDYCTGAFWGEMIDSYSVSLSTVYIPILVIMIASVIKEQFEGDALPVSYHKFIFALFGFIVAQIIILLSVVTAVNGHAIFGSVDVVNASFVNTLMMLAITLCFPEHKKALTNDNPAG